MHATEQLLKIKYRSIQDLRPYPRNARTHSKRQIRQIADSITAFGFTNPILIDGTNQIVAGHGRVKAAALLNITKLPTITLDDLTEDQIRAYIIADNKLAENAGWDKAILSIEFEHLISISSSLNFDVTATGFEVPEIDLILSGGDDSLDNGEDLTLVDSNSTPVSKDGDLWHLGPHRLLCGNCLNEASYRDLFGRQLASAVFSDPPFNVKIDGHATGNGKVRHREFAMASGEMSPQEFRNFLDACLALLAAYSKPESVHYLCMDWGHIETLLAAGSKTYAQLLNICVWVKNNGGMGSFYRSQHEMIAVFRNGKKGHRNNIQLGKFGRNRTNVWQYPGVNTLSKTGNEGNLLRFHPTVKPSKMVADAILDCTKRGDITLDCFLGSGTTLLAAEQTGRICYGIEIDPLYVDTAVRRWQDQTGEDAVHPTTGETFNTLAKERTAQIA